MNVTPHATNKGLTGDQVVDIWIVDDDTGPPYIGCNIRVWGMAFMTLPRIPADGDLTA